MTPLSALLVAGAGALAGAANALAGGGTLLSYPALLGAGLSPVTANVTSSVGLLAGYVGSSVSYRRELAGPSGRFKALVAPAIAGGLVGAVLLLALPGSAFRAVVPYLVLFACAVLALQPRLAKVLQARGVARSHPGWEAQAVVGFGAIYGTYFGAGLGVVLLAALALLIPDDLQRINALKGAVSLLVNFVGVAIFVVTGRVDWVAAIVLAIGAWVGAGLGVRQARRLSPAAVRTAVVLVGTAAGVTLLLT